MRGGGLHRWMVMGLDHDAKQAGYWTRIEPYVGNGFADLVIGTRDQLIVIEVELTPSRVQRDIEKALAINADLLIIVAADSTHKPRIRRQITLSPSNPGSGMRILVHSYPEVLRALTDLGGYLDRAEYHRTRTPNQ